jgi:predicted ATPase
VAIEGLRVSGYRSLRAVRLPLQRLNILVGPNGCGKSNLYRAMYLLTAAAGGRLAQTLAEEGGMPSVLWAGKRHKNEPVRVVFGVRLDQLDYELSLGLPTATRTAFILDPLVKEEHVRFRDARKALTLLERMHTTVKARNAEGEWVSFPMAVSESESVLSQLREPHQFPALSALCQEFLGWRFYHQFRTDPASPLRHPQVGVRTPVLGHDGRDLAAALQTILEIGDPAGLRRALRQAFPGTELIIDHDRARFSLALQPPEFPRRAFDGRELSDGTLHYLCLLAACFSPRPPQLLCVNEPETSIHPDLLEPLAHLLVHAAQESQVWITTHSEKLATTVQKLSGVAPLQLEKVEGETRLAGKGTAMEEDGEPD